MNKRENLTTIFFLHLFWLYHQNSINMECDLSLVCLYKKKRERENSAIYTVNTIKLLCNKSIYKNI